MPEYEDQAVTVPGARSVALPETGGDVARTGTNAGVDVVPTARDAGSDVVQTARDAGSDLAQTARDAGSDLARTTKEEARQVAHTAADQADRVRVGVRQRMREEVDRQHRQVTDRVGAFAQELATMAAERPDTPASELVGMLAERSRSFADYLDRHGPEKVLYELQNFARRRPGTFIVAAVAAGFVAGRLGKGLWQNEHEGHSS
jgi:gas vesicle protein